MGGVLQKVRISALPQSNSRPRPRPRHRGHAHMLRRLAATPTPPRIPPRPTAATPTLPRGYAPGSAVPTPYLSEHELILSLVALDTCL